MQLIRNVSFLLIFSLLFLKVGKSQDFIKFMDNRDDKVYQCVQLDNVFWMTENLNFLNGESKCYQNKPENCEKYGMLYKWEDAKTACPEGWELPSDYDWKMMERSAGMPDEIVDNRKFRIDQKMYQNVIDGGELGINLLFSGWMAGAKKPYHINRRGAYWTSTESGSKAWYRFIDNRQGIFRDMENKQYMYAVRCVCKDENKINRIATDDQVVRPIKQDKSLKKELLKAIDNEDYNEAERILSLLKKQSNLPELQTYSLEELNKQLEDAIMQEDYEKAEIIQKEIDKR